MPSPPLLRTATLIGMPWVEAVVSSCWVIWKQPSPSIAYTSSSGRPTLAPIAAGMAKPMVPRPPELIHDRGRLNRQNWEVHI